LEPWCPSALHKLLSINIKHCVDREFLDLFRSDLAGSAECVELLSPFVSINRSSNYHAAFVSLSARRVPVRAYVRPHQEQPDSLRPGYQEAIRNLEHRGVQVSPRPGMHEKVAAIDHRILWHGSLNILSHNNSRESMLRFESVDLVREVLQDLDLPGVRVGIGPGGPAVTHYEDEVPYRRGPHCSVCGGPMRFFESAGIWVCNDSPTCPGVRSIGAIEVEEAAASTRVRPVRLDMTCPICNSVMMVKGILRSQISCPEASCGFSLEPRLSAGILRVLAKRQPI